MASPMSLTLPERWDSALIVGRTPWSARDALVPLLRRRIRHLRSLRSRPGGRLRTRASAPPSDADGRTWQSKWHWAECLPHLISRAALWWGRRFHLPILALAASTLHAAAIRGTVVEN